VQNLFNNKIVNLYMVRLVMPAMSAEASGTLGKAIVFSNWKRLAYGRIRVVPKNPKSELQKTMRSILGTVAKASRVILTKAKDTPITGLGSQAFLDGNSHAPAGQSWISFLQQVTNPNFDDLVTAYGILTTVKTLYQAEAETDGMSSYTDKMGVDHSAGEQLYLLASFFSASCGYTGFADGIDEATAPQLASFSTYLTESTA
jgi:hypothetical protein